MRSVVSPSRLPGNMRLMSVLSVGQKRLPRFMEKLLIVGITSRLLPSTMPPSCSISRSIDTRREHTYSCCTSLPRIAPTIAQAFSPLPNR